MVNFSKVQPLEKVSLEMLKRLDVNYEYLAPEYFDGSQQISAKADLWAMGVLLYQWVHGAMPFKEKKEHNLFQTMRNIVEQPVPLDLDHTRLSPSLCSLIQGLL